MTPKFSPTPLVAGMDDRTLRHMAAVTGVANRTAEVVVVGQLVGENGEAADLLQHIATQRHSRAETGIRHPQPQTRQNIGQKLIVYSHGRQPRPQGPCGRACVKAGHETDRGIGERSHHLVEVCAPDPNIAVRQHHDLTPDRRLHIDQITNLAVLAIQPVVDHQGNIDGRIGALDVAHDPDRLIADIVNAADDLDATAIVLNAETFQVCEQARLCTM